VAAGLPPPGGSGGFLISPDGGPFKELTSSGSVPVEQVRAEVRSAIPSLEIWRCLHRPRHPRSPASLFLQIWLH
jgi:hypothetical protein